MKISKIEPILPEIQKRKRVAAYARVSMESDRLMHSLSAQISYYNAFIQKNPNWEYAGVYADNFISGTGTKKRTEFQHLMADCDAGLIDIILCKSISRFARNTVDLLESIRHLKEIGVEVRFEKENINSMTADGEFMLTILASFAQEESRSISENVRWATQKRFEKGIPNGRFVILGYRWEGDQLVIIPEEAEIVKRIYQNFLDGKSRLETERELNAEGITTKGGYQWSDSNIKIILTNITYTGNLLLQKEYIADPITKKRKKNHGELPQYFVENTHEAIIDMETFQYVQSEMQRRNELGFRANKSLNLSCFSGNIKCPYCNCSYVHNIRKDRGNPQEYWTCRSTKKKGGNCPVKGSINHKKLIEATEKIIGSTDNFAEMVEYIAVPGRETLEFHLTDGRVITEKCKKTGRKDCWTAEYRAAVSAKRRKHPTGKGTTFLTAKIICGQCGTNYRRSTSSKRKYWRCGKFCGNIGLREDYLFSLLEEMLGVNFKSEFSNFIDHIEVAEKLTFYFKDGKIKSIEWKGVKNAESNENTCNNQPICSNSD